MTTQLEFCSPLAPPLPLRRFSVAQYHQPGEFGVLNPEDNVELLEGWVIEKKNQRPIHGYIVRVLHEWLQNISDHCIERFQLLADSLEYRQTTVRATELLSIQVGETKLTLDLGIVFS